MSVDWLQVLCEGSLHPLARKLRRCGVNTLLLPVDASRDRMISMATDEQRILIVTNNTYYKVKENSSI